MPNDFWADAFDPLEMLNHLQEPPPRCSEARREQHNDLLNTYALRCLLGIGADYEADLFRDSAFGHSGSPDRL
ncbi:MAG: hypothetical protein K2V38_22215, partial [Gemmataceae bacterium]|nr:hypothetical protein [Gemmataceae bacterium]